MQLILLSNFDPIINGTIKRKKCVSINKYERVRDEVGKIQ